MQRDRCCDILVQPEANTHHLETIEDSFNNSGNWKKTLLLIRMPMHSVADSAYAAANEWLMSLGDDLDTEMDPEQSTVPSSPSDAYCKNSDSSQASPEYRSMHACMSTILFAFKL